MKRMDEIKRLVGEGITSEDLRHVDVHVIRDFGIFIPSVGFCGYAIQLRHTHPAYSFIVFFHGDQSMLPEPVTVPKDTYPAAAFSPDVPHEEDASGSFTRYAAILVSKEWFEERFSDYAPLPEAPYNWTPFSVSSGIMLPIKAFLAETEQDLPGGDSRSKALAILIIHELLRGLLGVRTAPAYSAGGRDVDLAIEYMHQHYGEKLTVNDLAALAHRSESHFNRLFKKKTGLSPMEYLIRLRLDKARKLLRSEGLTVTEIALQCGFATVSHFSASFAKHYRVSPSHYQSSFSVHRIETNTAEN